MRRSPERLLTGFVRLLLAVFFRRIEVEGAERVPLAGSLLIVANHVNGLLDPMLVLGCLPRAPRFLAKRTLWGVALVRPFLAWARAIPVDRPRDPGADPGRNVEAFAAARRVLAAGGAVALFPEGKSHDEPALTPLKTGAARIALDTVAEHPGLALRALPVGLVFDARERFRSRVLVEVGEPFPVAGEAGGAGPGPDAVRALTARLEAGLAAVTVNYASWEEARLVARAAELYARPALDVPRRPRLAALAAAQRAFATGYRDLAARHPERVAQVAAQLREYDRLLAAVGLRDEQVAATYPLPPVLRFLRRTLATLVLRLPLALLGTALNALPYHVVSLVARRVRGLDQKATWKLVGALVLYPLSWVAEAAAAGWAAGTTRWAVAAAVLALAPASGWFALRFHDRRSRLLAEVRAFLLLRTRQRFAHELQARRRAVYQAVAELVDLYRGEGGGGAALAPGPR